MFLHDNINVIKRLVRQIERMNENTMYSGIFTESDSLVTLPAKNLNIITYEHIFCSDYAPKWEAIPLSPEEAAETEETAMAASSGEKIESSDSKDEKNAKKDPIKVKDNFCKL